MSRDVPTVATAVYLHLGATLVMTGVIWFVQIVHYPLMAHVEPSAFSHYEQLHTQRTTWVVTPPMLVELATAISLVALRPPSIPAPLVWVGLLLVVLIWLSTFFVQVPQHTTLQQGFDADAHRVLVSSNWVRTISWTARSGLAVAFVFWLR